MCETAQIVKRLLTLDVILAKAVSASNDQLFRIIERRMGKSLNTVFLPMAAAALQELEGIEGDTPLTAGEAEALAKRIHGHFKPWRKNTTAIVNTIVDDAYRTAKQAMRERAHALYRKRGHVRKAAGDGPELRAAFSTEDEKAIDALSRHQVFWIGKQYDDTLSKQISGLTDEYMLRRGLGRSEAGGHLKDELAREFGLKSGPLDRGPGLELPSGWKGTTPDYFRMLSANTVTNARTQGMVREMHGLGITEYVVVNPDDEKTCPICHDLNGKTFKVEEAQNRLDKETNAADPERVREIHPWANSVADIKGAANLMLAGFGYPPYHGVCRCGVDINEESMPELAPDALAPEPTDMPEADWDGATSYADKSDKEAEVWGMAEFEHWASKLTDDQELVIRRYQNNAHRTMNGILRDNLDKVESRPLLADERSLALKRIDKLSAALDTAKLPSDTITYRGLPASAGAVFTPGAVIEDPAFTSTALRPSVVLNFAEKKDDIVMEILVPKGSHAAYLDATREYPNGELELLLQKGTRFKVVGIEDKEIAGEVRTVIRVIAEVP